jgi:alkylated DNA repair dioxygenase AlkB
VSGPLGCQASLFDGVGDEPSFDERLDGRRRVELAHGAWVDVVPGWLRGADTLFHRVLARTPWQGRDVRMYDRVVREPRLTHRWVLAGSAPAELPDPVLASMAELLSAEYGERFTQVGANLYRDGADSVAWHGDRVARDLPTATVALVSLGAVRPFRLRPTGGGRSIELLPGPGDLLVLGGTCQRTWQHAVPKARGVGPRISIQFRHVYPAAPGSPDTAALADSPREALDPATR